MEIVQPASRGKRVETGAHALLRIEWLQPCPTQPMYRPAQVRWLVANWRDDHMHPIRVYRRDGQWYIRNGQHRWLAARALGHETILCHVHDRPSRYWHQVAAGRGLRFWFDGVCPYTPPDEPDPEYVGQS